MGCKLRIQSESMIFGTAATAARKEGPAVIPAKTVYENAHSRRENVFEFPFPPRECICSVCEWSVETQAWAMDQLHLDVLEHQRHDSSEPESVTSAQTLQESKERARGSCRPRAARPGILCLSKQTEQLHALLLCG